MQPWPYTNAPKHKAAEIAGGLNSESEQHLPTKQKASTSQDDPAPWPVALDHEADEPPPIAMPLAGNGFDFLDGMCASQWQWAFVRLMEPLL